MMESSSRGTSVSRGISRRRRVLITPSRFLATTIPRSLGGAFNGGSSGVLHLNPAAAAAVGAAAVGACAMMALTSAPADPVERELGHDRGDEQAGNADKVQMVVAPTRGCKSRKSQISHSWQACWTKSAFLDIDLDENTSKRGSGRDLKPGSEFDILCTSAAHATAPALVSERPRRDIHQFDFIVVGHGNCGRSAVRTLRRRCPTATIAVVDPHIVRTGHSGMKDPPSLGEGRPGRSGGSTELHGGRHEDESDDGMRYFANAACGLDTSTRSLHLSDGSKICYEHSILLATGSRGAPPPASLVDPRAWGRVLELRSTAIPPSGSGTRIMTPATATPADPHRPPSLPPGTVRDLAHLATSQGATVCVLGSGLEALELAASLASVAANSSNAANTAVGKKRPRKEDRGRNDGIADTTMMAMDDDEDGGNDKGSKVILLFGDAGPLSRRLPRYLSTAVTRRLLQQNRQRNRQRGGGGGIGTLAVDVHERSLVRYVSLLDARGGMPPRLEVHAAKVSDTLDTKRLLADLIVVAPPVDGQRGTGVVPTGTTLRSNIERTGCTTPNVVVPPLESACWSDLATDGTVTCFADDGRVVVNAELLAAASGVYAAGSVARYPSGTTGRSEVAGEGTYDAAVAGRVAATNMCLDYERVRDAIGGATRNHPQSDDGLFATAGRGGIEKNGVEHARIDECDTVRTFSPQSLPIWRTDHFPYAKNVSYPSGTEDDALSRATSTSLASLGIEALCVGNCDSETMATHGFWWTNQSSNRRDRSQTQQNLSYDESSSEDDEEAESDDVAGDNGEGQENGRRVVLMTRKTARRGAPSVVSNVSSSRGRPRPVYGTGIVYYFDRSGRLRGIMTWGIPFTQSPGVLTLNNGLVGRLKELLAMNGEVAKLHDATHGGMLSVQDLAEESKHLVSIACESWSFTENIFLSDGSMSRPLHRYLPAKPSSVSGLGTLRRKEDVALEEDTFMRHLGNDNNISQRPPSLVPISPMDSGYQGIFSSLSRAQRENTSGEASFTDERRCRPPKEDALWLRQEDSRRSSSVHAMMSNIFQHNMRRGKFADGTDGHEPPPLPKALQRAVSKLQGMTSSQDTHEFDENKDDSQDGTAYCRGH